MGAEALESEITLAWASSGQEDLYRRSGMAEVLVETEMGRAHRFLQRTASRRHGVLRLQVSQPKLLRGQETLARGLLCPRISRGARAANLAAIANFEVSKGWSQGPGSCRIAALGHAPGVAYGSYGVHGAHSLSAHEARAYIAQKEPVP